MSKPIIDLIDPNAEIWDNNKNTILHILDVLPKFDYDFMDVISHKTHNDQIVLMTSMIYTVLCELKDKYMVKRMPEGELIYKEDKYNITFGFMRMKNKQNKKKTMLGIMIEDYNIDNAYVYGNTTGIVNSNHSIPFMLAIEVNDMDRDFIKTYILNKCIRNKDMFNKIFCRLYHISR